MKTGTMILIGAAAIAGLVWYSKNAAGQGVGTMVNNGGYIPDIAGVNPLKGVIANRTAQQIAEDKNTYTLAGKTSGTTYGSYNAGEIQTLLNNKAVIQGSKTTKIEAISTTLAAGSSLSRPAVTTQLITVEPSTRDSKGETAFDKIVRANFAAKGQAYPY
jgi:hypothetical protein